MQAKPDIGTSINVAAHFVNWISEHYKKNLRQPTYKTREVRTIIDSLSEEQKQAYQQYVENEAKKHSELSNTKFDAIGLVLSSLDNLDDLLKQTSIDVNIQNPNVQVAGIESQITKNNCVSPLVLVPGYQSIKPVVNIQKTTSFVDKIREKFFSNADSQQPKNH